MLVVTYSFLLGHDLFPFNTCNCLLAGTEPQTQGLAGDSSHTFFSGSKASTTLGGKASEQPERTPLSKEEIEAIMVCGICAFAVKISTLLI